jgi:ribosomal protein L37AE/L43A
MQPKRSTAAKGETDPDIFFQCNHCQASLVVNRAAAGMRLNCQRCGQPTVVPTPSQPTADVVAQGQEIQRKLKENESQRTEVTGYINQLSIQLHRWQLRLQTLNERKQQLEKELGSLKT